MSGVGITPAWAGKSQTLHFNSHRTGDHPRVGGEKAKGKPKSQGHLGSPPHRRGKGWNPCWRGLLNRITPAWAGKRKKDARGGSSSRDHPRVGGEKGGRTISFPLALGSPPRGRGKVEWADKNLPSMGITPAWAGKRMRRRKQRQRQRDHPRVGGEKFSGYVPSFTGIGSPPRGRGKEYHNRRAGGTDRITPAWAGKR